MTLLPQARLMRVIRLSCQGALPPLPTTSGNYPTIFKQQQSTKHKMPTITVGPNSLRFINGGAVVTTYATLYPTGYKQVAGNKRVGTWNCPVRGCANHNGQGYSSESSVRNHMTVS